MRPVGKKPQKKSRKAIYDKEKESYNSDARATRGRDSKITSMMSGRKHQRKEHKPKKDKEEHRNRKERKKRAKKHHKDKRRDRKGKDERKDSKRQTTNHSRTGSGRVSRNPERLKRKEEKKKVEEIQEKKSDAQLLYKEIQDQFMSALKKVEELEKLSGGNPISKIAFKKELTKFLGACRSKAKKADRVAELSNN